MPLDQLIDFREIFLSDFKFAQRFIQIRHATSTSRTLVKNFLDYFLILDIQELHFKTFHQIQILH